MPILSFEEQTRSLNTKDIELVDTIKEILVSVLIPDISPKKSGALAFLISYKLQKDYGIYDTINDVKLRKWVSYFRTNGLLPIIATSEGYFITAKSELIRDQQKSLRQRASRMNSAADGLEIFIK